MIDRNAVVTGASGALGAAIAKALSVSGYNVWLLGRSLERLENTRKHVGDRALGVVTCDVADPENVQHAVKSILEKGPVHVLVNNAGIVKDDVCMRMSEEAWDAVLNTNLKGAFLLSKGFIRSMMREKFGRIINVTSISSDAGNAGQCNYAASKAGLVGMTKALAVEVGRKGVTVNCVSPGFIDSDMTAVLTEEQREIWIARTPVGRIGRPEEIGHAVAFLASEGASYITGHVLCVNGGAYCA